MKKIFFRVLIVSFGGIISFTCCEKPDPIIGNSPPSSPSTNAVRWTRLENLSKGAGQTIVLGIDTKKVYIGETESKGLWKYNYETNGFTEIPGFPSQAVCCSMESFSVNGKGYLGMGNARGATFDNNEMYEFDPVSNKWKQKNDAPISGAATTFVIDGFVYILQSRAVWKYDPQNDTCTQKNDFPGAHSFFLTSSFVINGLGYFVSGSRCWEYEPYSDRWLQKADLPGHLEVQASFSLNNYGYVLADSSHASRGLDYPLQLWQLDPLNDHWIRVPKDYPGNGTSQVKTISLDGVAYVGFGYKNLNNANADDNLASDFWKIE